MPSRRRCWHASRPSGRPQPAPVWRRWRRPSGEREGTVTVACESAVWAQELELLGPDVLARLNERLGLREAERVKRLRFVVGSPPNRY